jgi:hypothetical protein
LSAVGFRVVVGGLAIVEPIGVARGDVEAVQDASAIQQFWSGLYLLREFVQEPFD